MPIYTGTHTYTHTHAHTHAHAHAHTHAHTCRHTYTHIYTSKTAYTQAYSPPEVLSQPADDEVVEVSPKADIWALGVILYILIAGRSVFHLCTDVYVY